MWILRRTHRGLAAHDAYLAGNGTKLPNVYKISLDQIKNQHCWIQKAKQSYLPYEAGERCYIL